jgi:hypothetical protein
LVFLDADVLAAPTTRSLILFGSLAPGSNYVARWSEAAEREADAALDSQWQAARSRASAGDRVRPLSVRSLRTSQEASDWGERAIVAPAPGALEAGLVHTDRKDRHVLAAASACGARLVVSGNIRDFGAVDLARLGMSAAHPDLFLSLAFTVETYSAVLKSLASRRGREPNTPASIHSALIQSHPRLARSMSAAFPGTALSAPVPNQPREVFRGVACVGCGQRLSDTSSAECGVCPTCSAKT